ncbi:MAG TPA: hypothetical protein VM536_19660, partial [Chloroflexia bacterium]|nr:hypothetical protein [Chloroflexia bacterium]
TKAAAAYGSEQVNERHRHRFEFNNAYRDRLEEAGLVISGLSPDGRLVEIVELRDHPWFVATQFHPELRSRPTNPHPLFREFIAAANRLHMSRRAQGAAVNQADGHSNGHHPSVAVPVAVPAGDASAPGA